MTPQQYRALDQFRRDFKTQLCAWNDALPELSRLQKEAADADRIPPYPIETPIVYNNSLDDFTESSDIRLIVVGDNPGKDEQRTKNNRYFVGQSGKLGDGFFKNHFDELHVAFRKNVLILNKTPIHTARTSQLKYIIAHGGSALVQETQRWMAQRTGMLASSLKAHIWLVGYSELQKKNGIFREYRNELKRSASWDSLFVFRHFSMNQFSTDLKNFVAQHPELSFKDALILLGQTHRNEIFV